MKKPEANNGLSELGLCIWRTYGTDLLSSRYRQGVFSQTYLQLAMSSQAITASHQSSSYVKAVFSDSLTANCKYLPFLLGRLPACSFSSSYINTVDGCVCVFSTHKLIDLHVIYEVSYVGACFGVWWKFCPLKKLPPFSSAVDVLKSERL